jgi:hypothetical protein
VHTTTPNLLLFEMEISQKFSLALASNSCKDYRYDTIPGSFLLLFQVYFMLVHLSSMYLWGNYCVLSPQHVIRCKMMNYIGPVLFALQEFEAS